MSWSDEAASWLVDAQPAPRVSGRAARAARQDDRSMVGLRTLAPAGCTESSAPARRGKRPSRAHQDVAQPPRPDSIADALWSLAGQKGDLDRPLEPEGGLPSLYPYVRSHHGRHRHAPGWAPSFSSCSAGRAHRMPHGHLRADGPERAIRLLRGERVEEPMHAGQRPLDRARRRPCRGVLPHAGVSRRLEEGREAGIGSTTSSCGTASAAASSPKTASATRARPSRAANATKGPGRSSDNADQRLAACTTAGYTKKDGNTFVHHGACIGPRGRYCADGCLVDEIQRLCEGKWLPADSHDAADAACRRGTPPMSGNAGTSQVSRRPPTSCPRRPQSPRREPRQVGSSVAAAKRASAARTVSRGCAPAGLRTCALHLKPFGGSARRYVTRPAFSSSVT